MITYVVEVMRERTVRERTMVEIESETKLAKSELFERAQKEVEAETSEGWELYDAFDPKVIECEIIEGEEDIKQAA
jgi:hypothetical protein